MDRTPESEAAEKGMGRGEVGGKSECEPQGRGEALACRGSWGKTTVAGVREEMSKQ